MSKLKWLRGRLALSDGERYEEGLGDYAEALSYAARDGDAELAQMLSRIDRQAEHLASQGARGLALVFYDYLHVFARDQGFGKGILSRLSDKREKILRRPSLP